MPGKKRALEGRFWPKVEKTDGCWLWTATKNAQGYGRIVGSTPGLVSAHRVAYELAFGPFDLTLDVLHHCDTPSCVKTEPDERYPNGHLFLGTAKDNMADASAKGRTIRIFSPTQDAEIYGRRERETVASLAAAYGVSSNTIYRSLARFTGAATWR